MSSPRVYIQACTNGRLHDAREPSIAAIDRGYLYGDAIYEVWRTYHGVLFAWDEHWRRLEQSAASLHFPPLPLTAAEALAEVRRTLAAYLDHEHASVDYYVRLQITRGEGAIGLDTGLADRPGYVILVQPNRPYAPEKLQPGLTLSLATSLRRNPAEALNPAWKTGNYLNNILCLREARARGADEVVITNLAGDVTEAAVSNIAFVRAGVVITPPLGAGLLAGITRSLMLTRVAPRINCQTREMSIHPADFSGMTECFLLSTTKDITPVAKIDAHSFYVGPDSVALKLKAAFAEVAREYATSHPEFRIA